MPDYLNRADKVLQRIHELAAISEDSQGITRTFGTKAFLQGSAQVRLWMESAGLQTRIDSIGNVRGRLISKNANAKTFVIASHIDTVVNASRFDGPLGVLAGLDLLENLIQNWVSLPFHIELIAFSDEEGVRFHSTYLGSKVVAGSFDPDFLRKQDPDGISLKEALIQMGGDPTNLSADAMAANDWLGYFEIHIEQGPVLYERNIPIAPVTAIAGQMRVEITFSGMAGHAGTVPMNMRQDALCAAAEFVLEAERFALTHGQGLVATVGKLHINGSASNVIPGQVTCSLDLRAPNEAQLKEAYNQLSAQAASLCKTRKIELNWNLIQQTAPVVCDAALNQLLIQAINESGFPIIPLVSGAGHDAVPISQVSPATMLFVRCYKGISHNPSENAEAADIASALQVSDKFLSLLISKHQNQ